MPRLFRIYLWVAAAWVVLFTARSIDGVQSARPIQDQLRSDCPQLVIPVLPPRLNAVTLSRTEWTELIAWFDETTGKEIFLGSQGFRRYTETRTCEQLRAEARSLLARIDRGAIRPVLRVKYGTLLVVILLPPLVLLLPFLLLGRAPWRPATDDSGFADTMPLHRAPERQSVRRMR